MLIGPQCYVKPSGKSNRKIIVNAISYVCLSGTVNQEQKEKCLQVCENKQTNRQRHVVFFFQLQLFKVLTNNVQLSRNIDFFHFGLQI